MQRITVSNQHYKNAKKLKQKKYRDESACFLIEGEKLIREAFNYGLDICAVFCTQDAYDKFLILHNLEVYLVDEKMICELTESVSPQGVAAVCKIPAAADRSVDSVLILDHIQDPGNVGAILRTAAATGYSTVYLCNCADPFSMKCLRSGMSAQFSLNLIECETSDALMKGYEVFAADMDGEDVFAINAVSKRHALVIGNEGNGLSEEIKQTCKCLSLKMKNGVESLNAACAASVFMYVLSSKVE